MSRLNPLRILAGVLMAAVLGAFAFLHRSRPPRRATPTSPTKPAPSAEDADGETAQPPPPLLKPLMFTVSHFGLLTLLLLMMFVGLAFRGIERYPQGTTFHVNGGDPDRGRQHIARYGCGGCHQIPGVRGATGTVGPSLATFGRQMYIAGQLPNTPEHLIDWLQDPQRLAPGTAMPDLGVTEAEARDIAAYLYAASRK